MNWPYTAAMLLIGAGVSLAFALLWLRRAASLRRHVLEELLDLRPRLEQEPLQGLAQSGALILRLGLPGMRWQGRWYGAEVSGHVGAATETVSSANLLVRDMVQPDVSLRLFVSLHGLRGEARLFAEQSAQLLFAIFEGALAARELALVSAMAQRARVAVFVQHDMRNLTQWVELVADDLDYAQTPDQLLESARRVQQGAVIARDRAQRIAAAMLRPGAGQDDSEQWQAVDLLGDLTHASAMHQIELRLDPVSAPALALQLNSQAWATVLDNLMGNISRLARERLETAHCTVRWTRRADTADIAFDTPDLKLRVPLERLFEPWGGSQPGGSGLGLYQARRAALAAGGDLRAERCGDGIRVTLSLPCKNS